MRKRFVLLQALAILTTVLRYGMRAEGWDEGSRIVSNIFCPYLPARYVRKLLELVVSNDVPFPISTTTYVHGTCSSSLKSHILAIP